MENKKINTEKKTEKTLETKKSSYIPKSGKQSTNKKIRPQAEEFEILY